MKEDLVAYIRKVVREEISHLQQGVKTPYLYGTWLAAESVDPNLSQVQLEGEGVVVRGVRKLASVTGLVPGKQVLMLKHGVVPLTIIGAVVGDITKIEVN